MQGFTVLVKGRMSRLGNGKADWRVMQDGHGSCVRFHPVHV